jgi:hypothetical protein
LCDRTPGTISFESIDGTSKSFCAISLIVDSFTFWDIDPAGSRTIELLYAPSDLLGDRAIDSAESRTFVCPQDNLAIDSVINSNWDNSTTC